MNGKQYFDVARWLAASLWLGLLSACATNSMSGETAPALRANAVAQAAEGDLDKAEASIRMALAKDPRSAEANYVYGMILAQQGKEELSIVGLRRTLDLHPGHGGALYNLGTMHLRRGEIIDACSYLERAVEVAPNHAPSFNNLGRAYYELELPELAIVAFERAFELDPNHPSAGESLELLRSAVSEAGP